MKRKELLDKCKNTQLLIEEVKKLLPQSNDSVSFDFEDELELSIFDNSISIESSVDEDEFEFKPEKTFLLHVDTNILNSTDYVGEVFGVGQEESGEFYAFYKNESLDETCFNKNCTKVGLIVPEECYLSMLNENVKLDGYDFFGSFYQNVWMFHYKDKTYMNLVEIDSVNNLFSRNIGLFESKEMLEKYAVMVGCGSVGSFVALELAKAGVGKFILLDGDVMKFHNLCRHQLGVKYLARYKVDGLKEAILNINPYAEVITYRGYLQDAPVDLFNLDSNGIVISSADNRKGSADANELAVLLGVPFVAIGCWQRAAAGEVFYWHEGLPTYYKAFDGLISDERPETNAQYFGSDTEKNAIHFEPGTSIDIAYVTIIGIKICMDLINLNSSNYTTRVLDYLTYYTLICNTNKKEIGGENVIDFPHPLFIGDGTELLGKKNE